jgi:hypothetical protein
MNSQDKNQLNRAIPAATFDAILGKLDGQPPDKQGFSGCIFCEDEERGTTQLLGFLSATGKPLTRL